MMRTAISYLVWIGALLCGLQACRPAPDTPAGDDNPQVRPRVLPTLADSVPYPARNPLTEAGIALGRALFYDPILSGNGEISCATCHQPDRAFSDGVAIGNLGQSGERLLRHTPTLTNVAWAKPWFWDGGATDLESQTFGPLTHADEMGADLREVAARLRAHPSYPAQFRRAFGVDSLTAPHIARALAQFQRTMISDRSRYDRVVQQAAAYSPAESRGLMVWRTHCSSCHQIGLFTDNDFHNNGLDADFSDDSHEGIYQGRFRITHDSADLGAFKTPTLRNVALTAPYMHDGRFGTLEQVVDHYRFGVRDSPSLSPRLRSEDGTPGIPLDDVEALDLIAFLHTLTDTAFVRNPALRPAADSSHENQNAPLALGAGALGPVGP